MVPWPSRLSWLVVAATAIPAISGALEGRSAAVATVVTVEGWLLWAAAWLATLVPRTASLTAYRTLAPMSLAAAVASLAAGADLPTGLLFIAAAVIATVIACAGVTTDAFVDGSSYGNERRFGLRVPPLIAAVAVPLSWAIVLAAAVTPPLLAAHAWAPAGAALVIGGVGTRRALQSLHQLSRRWIVFVPAGMVLHDPLVLADAVLFPRRTITALGPALAESTATDLTQHALGLCLEARLADNFTLGVRSGKGRQATEIETDHFLFTPLRPGALLEAAAQARVAVG